MSRVEKADKIEGIVGTKRHPTMHYAKADSTEQRVYLLHSAECLASGIDLRDCSLSEALDVGIDLIVWAEYQDRPVVVSVDPEHFDLVPESK